MQYAQKAFTNKFSQKKEEKATTVGRLLRTAITTNGESVPRNNKKKPNNTRVAWTRKRKYRFRKSTNARVGRKYVLKMHTLQRGGGGRCSCLD